MKKLISLLIALAMLVSFAACGEANLPTYSQGLTKNGYYDIKIADCVTLPDYKGMTIPADQVNVSDAEVEETLQSIASSNQETKEVTDRAVEYGDQVNIDYTGYFGEEAFEGGTAVDQMVTAGGTNFIDDFLTQIIGHMPGESFDVNVSFPDEYPNNPDYAGKEARFFVVINYIAEYIVPEITDEFIKETCEETYGVSTVADMKQYIKDTLEKNKKLTYIDDYLYNGATFGEIPEAVIQHQKNCVIGNYQDMAANYGVDVETIVAYSGYESLEALIEDSEDQIAEMAKDMLLYQAVANDLKLKVSNKDVADYFEKTAGTRDYSLYQDHYGLPYLKMMVLNEMATDYIIENAQ